jgi:hypothetical protein
MRNYKVGAQLVEILENNEAVKEVLDTNEIYPLVAILDSTDSGQSIDVHFPFVIYRRTNYQPESTKDMDSEKVWVEFMVAAKTYQQSLIIAERICEALYKKETDIIDDIRFSSLYEDWMDETFLQFINVEVTMKE